MSFNYNKLRGRIIEKYGTLAAFAEVLGVYKQDLSRKMKGHTRFTQDDVVRWRKLLDIPQEDIGVFFFNEELKESDFNEESET